LHKKKELEARKIALHIDASVPQKLGITNQDLICGLGNLLDNAAEACSSVPNAEILLSVRYKPPYLQIDITNPLPDHPDKKVPRIPELTRGLGQAILRDLAVRYDGHYQFTRQDGIFHAVLFMKEDSQQEKVL
jgi:sensor histidine kinase regulating citrate/malate metabolism